jgi:aspartyl-tRNA(Asn)/glutamyl-tRNA(Gln) amidotransferase subunit C
MTESAIFVNNPFGMEVNDALVDHLSELARLEFNSQDKEEIKKDLQRMISFVEKLKELDTTGITPVSHMSQEVNRLREDLAQVSISRQEALQNAPLTDGLYFKVPKVIKNTFK